MKRVFSCLIILGITQAVLAMPNINLVGVKFSKNQKTKCKMFFKNGAVVVTFCPSETSPADMIADFIEVSNFNGWRLPIFEVFSDEKKTPKNNATYLKLPNIYKYQSHTIQIDKGAVIEKACFKEGKTTPCNF